MVFSRAALGASAEIFASKLFCSMSRNTTYRTMVPAFAAIPVIDEASFRGKVAQIEIDLTALEFTNLRYLAEEAAGRDIGPKASLLKIRGSEVRQQIAELCVEALGYYAYPSLEPDPAGTNVPPIGADYTSAQMPEFLYSRAATIYGGSNEIQRNIMAKMVLGL